MRARLLITLLVATAWLGGCQSWLVPQARPLAPPLGSDHNLQHRLRIERDDRALNLHAVLASTPGDTRVVAMTETGVPVFQLHQTTQGLETQQSALMPEAVPMSLILADIQLVFWPAAALRDALPPPWTLRREPHGRALYKGDRLEARVRYRHRDGWHGPATLDNLHHGYRLTITPLQSEGTE